MRQTSTIVIGLFLLTTYVVGQPRRKVVKPSPKSQTQAGKADSSDDLIVIEGNSIRTKWIPVGTQGTQSMFVGAAYDQGGDSVGFSVLSIDKNYHYESYKDLRILVDGEPLLFFSAVLRQGGVSGVDATERLSTTILLSEFTRMISARRVDISVGVDRLTFNPSTNLVFARFLKAIEAMAKSEPKCDLNLSQAPELRGFRLGMTVEEVQQVFPGSEAATAGRPEAPIKVARNDISEIRLNPKDPSDAMNRYELHGRSVFSYFEGSSTRRDGREDTTWLLIIQFDKTQFPEYADLFLANLTILNGRIARIEVAYKNEGAWKDADFLETIKKTLNLPNAWKGSTMDCVGWSLRVDTTYGNPTLELTDLVATSKAKDNQSEKARQENERKRKLFKP